MHSPAGQARQVQARSAMLQSSTHHATSRRNAAGCRSEGRKALGKNQHKYVVVSRTFIVNLDLVALGRAFIAIGLAILAAHRSVDLGADAGLLALSCKPGEVSR